MCNIKTSSWLEISGSFLGTQLLQKIFKREEGILFFCVIITELIQNLLMEFLKFDGFHVHVQPVMLNLINIG